MTSFTYRPSRRERRHIARQLERMVERAVAHCTLCGSAFPHNSRTAGGVTHAGTLALVGSCCANQLQWVAMHGHFVDRDYGLPFLDGIDRQQRSLADIDATIGASQRLVARLDRAENELREAGVEPTNLWWANYRWKQDDAAWFAAHSQRSHRARPRLDGELFQRDPESGPILDGHTVEVVVRQHKPGLRTRATWHRLVQAPTPDRESLLHALFDLITTGSRRVITLREVYDRERQYLEAAARRPT